MSIFVFSQGKFALSYTIYLETALPNIFGQKSVIENMADCDVKRVTGPYFFRMIADQQGLNGQWARFPPPLIL